VATATEPFSAKNYILSSGNHTKLLKRMYEELMGAQGNSKEGFVMLQRVLSCASSEKYTAELKVGMSTE
jgi:uncharacterized protein YaaW (UPF0174 family)